ncbi:ABC transporter substrate-binding protein [Streptomyces sp. NPDC015414]|uniref:ABC transporter substrate-binding protein n=1 Tax=Streptomyces sp. NPDC015414 TaxID=3364957 RepID=UPI00370361CE
MRTHQLTAATAAALFVVTATGCSSSSSSGDEKDGPVTLTYAMWQQDQMPAFRKIFDEFTRQNPGIKVKIQITGFNQYFSKLQNEASTGSLPDVFWLNPYNFPLYASQGVIAPVDERAQKAGFAFDAIPQTMRSMYTWKGKLYSLPNNRDAIVVFYNKQLFDHAKLPYPKPSWTWQDFRATARKLTRGKDGVHGTAVSLDQGHVSVQTTVPEAGGTILSDDLRKNGFGTPEAKAGVRFWTDLVADGSSPNLSQLAETDMNSLFLSGKIGMLYQGSWFANQYAASQLAKQGKIGIVTVPQGPRGNATPTSSLGNVMPAKARHPEASYKLIQFLGSKAAAEIYTRAGVGLTAYPETAKNYEDKFAKSFDLAPVDQAVQDGFPLPASLNSAVWTKLIVDDLTPAFQQKQDVDSACDKLAGDMQKALDQEKQLGRG